MVKGRSCAHEQRQGTPIAFPCPLLTLFRAKMVIPTPHRGAEKTLAPVRQQK
jgi:hypothetical protein